MLAWPLSLHTWSPSAPSPRGTLSKATRFPRSLSSPPPTPCPSAIALDKRAGFEFSVYDRCHGVASPQGHTCPYLCLCPRHCALHRVGSGSIKFFELVNKCITATSDLCPKSSRSSTPGPVYASKPQTRPEIGIPEEATHSFFLPSSSFHFKIRKLESLGFGVSPASPLALGPSLSIVPCEPQLLRL